MSCGRDGMMSLQGRLLFGWLLILNRVNKSHCGGGNFLQFLKLTFKQHGGPTVDEASTLSGRTGLLCHGAIEPHWMAQCL